MANDSNSHKLLWPISISVGLLGFIAGTDVLVMLRNGAIGLGLILAGIALVVLSTAIKGPPPNTSQRPAAAILRSIAMTGSAASVLAVYLVALGIVRGGVFLVFNPIVAFLFLVIAVVMLRGWLRGVRLPR